MPLSLSSKNLTKNFISMMNRTTGRESCLLAFHCRGCARLSASTRAGDSVPRPIIDQEGAIITPNTIKILMDVPPTYPLMT